jgi:hypothetical protein
MIKVYVLGTYFIKSMALASSSGMYVEGVVGSDLGWRVILGWISL